MTKRKTERQPTIIVRQAVDTFTYDEKTLAKLWPEHTKLMAECEERAKWWEENSRFVPEFHSDIYRMIARLAALGRGR